MENGTLRLRIKKSKFSNRRRERRRRRRRNCASNCFRWYLTRWCVGVCARVQSRFTCTRKELHGKIENSPHSPLRLLSSFFLASQPFISSSFTWSDA